jgi:hypothetical protein
MKTEQLMTREVHTCFLKHLAERLAINDEAAAATLASWLVNYEPGVLALARAGVRTERSGRKQGIAA